MLKMLYPTFFSCKLDIQFQCTFSGNGKMVIRLTPLKADQSNQDWEREETNREVEGGRRLAERRVGKEEGNILPHKPPGQELAMYSQFLCTVMSRVLKSSSAMLQFCIKKGQWDCG